MVTVKPELACNNNPLSEAEDLAADSAPMVTENSSSAKRAPDGELLPEHTRFGGFHSHGGTSKSSIFGWDFPWKEPIYFGVPASHLNRSGTAMVNSELYI